MKKLLSIFLAMSIALTTIPAKADPYDANTIASAALVTVGVASALISYNLAKTHDKEKTKLSKILTTTPGCLDWENYNKRSKNNLLRYFGSHAAGLLSIASGLALLAYNYFHKK